MLFSFLPFLRLRAGFSMRMIHKTAKLMELVALRAEELRKVAARGMARGL